jgi:serine/threonine-protein kinase
MARADALWQSRRPVEHLGEQDLEGVPQPGEVLHGKYRLERVLGAGGMGVVMAATHLLLNQPVAIKFLLAKAARNPKNVTRFVREAQAAARIESDHVTRVSDVGTLENGTPFMVMEFLKGEDLAAVLTRGRVAVPTAVDYVLQACLALAEAHKNGIVHRDLKPGNLFLAERADATRRIKVLDFGISKFIEEPGRPADVLTRTTALMGSPLYMSPEQMKSAKAADHRADIWALGAILFELISGEPPFIGATLPEICSHILTDPPSPIRTLVPFLPPALEAAIDRCLCKDPAGRFQSLSELAHAIAPFGVPESMQRAATVARVLGAVGGTVPFPPNFASPAFAPSDPAAIAAALAGSASAASASGPHEIVTARGGFAVPAAPFAPPGSSPGTGTGPEGHPLVASQPIPHPALAAGSATGVPVTQTMPEQARGRGRIAVVVSACLLAGAASAAIVLWPKERGDAERAGGPPSATATGAPPAATAPDKSAEPTASDAATAPSATTGEATAVLSARSATPRARGEQPAAEKQRPAPKAPSTASASHKPPPASPASAKAPPPKSHTPGRDPRFE